MRTNLVIVENGKFIFDTNFAGDPKKDRFGSDERKENSIYDYRSCIFETFKIIN